MRCCRCGKGIIYNLICKNCGGYNFKEQTPVFFYQLSEEDSDNGLEIEKICDKQGRIVGICLEREVADEIKKFYLSQLNKQYKESIS